MRFPLELLLDLREDVRTRRFFSFLAFSSLTSSLMSACVSTITCCCAPAGSPGDRMAKGEAMGVQSGSASSKTGGNMSSRSSSEMKDEAVSLSSLLEFEDSDERRGQEGYAQEGDCGRELLVEGISMGKVV